MNNHEISIAVEETGGDEFRAADIAVRTGETITKVREVISDMRKSNLVTMIRKGVYVYGEAPSAQSAPPSPSGKILAAIEKEAHRTSVRMEVLKERIKRLEDELTRTKKALDDAEKFYDAFKLAMDSLGGSND